MRRLFLFAPFLGEKITAQSAKNTDPFMTDNQRGATLMMLSMAAFVLNDTFVKLLGGHIPLFEILFLRGIVATVALVIMCWYLQALKFQHSARDWTLMIARSASEIAAAYFFLTALIHMPIANVTAILQTLPLTVSLGGVLLFKNPIGWRRLLAILVGFGGMMLIVRPGSDGFDVYSIYVLIAVLCVTARDLTTRAMSKAVPSLFVTLLASLSVTVYSGIMMIGADFTPMSGLDQFCLLASAFFIVGGYAFSVLVMRVGDISFVALFRYSAVIWTLFIGLWVFGDWPDAQTLIGAAIIALSGGYTMLREARIRRRSTTA